MKAIEMEKGILANDLASLKLELSVKGISTSKKNFNYKTSYQPSDANYQKWLTIKNNIESQYQIRPNFMANFELRITHI